MRIIWSDFDYDSPNSIKMRNAKAVNGPDYWPTMREVFAYDLQHLPLSRFRHWASSHNVPLITTYRTCWFLGAAFTAAAKDQNYADALRENWIGVINGFESDFRVCEDYDTSMQRVQDVAHLYLCGYTPEEIQNLDSIVEIGGGYGDMCSVIHALGFKGKYTIYDLPEIQGVQKYYLEKQGINANFVNLNNIDDLEPADMVIATWSLSEIPITDRTPIMDRIVSSKKWLVMYQKHIFGNIDNTEYFQNIFTNAQYIKLNETSYDGDNTYMVIK